MRSTITVIIIALIGAMAGTALFLAVSGISFSPLSDLTPFIFYCRACAVSVILWVVAYHSKMKSDKSIKCLLVVSLVLPLIGCILVTGSLIGAYGYLCYSFIFIPMSFAVAMLIRLCTSRPRGAA